jgi:serine/threonine-protein kinase SRK2
MQKADLWSCGVILFALLYGRYPFDATERHYARKVVTAEYTIPEQVPVSAECTALMQRLLCPDPKARICMEDILAQPWFCEALPEGALTMNDYYLAGSVDLSEVITAITSVTVVIKESSGFDTQVGSSCLVDDCHCTMF